MVPILQCRPDRRTKIDPDKIREEHKEEEDFVDEEGSDSGIENDENEDQESIAYQNQSSSSDTETENSDMMMTGSSFWVSELGNNTPSGRKSRIDEAESSEKFIQRLKEEEKREAKISKVNKVVKNKKTTNISNYKVNVKHSEPVKEEKKKEDLKEQESKDSKGLLSPDKSEIVESKSSMSSAVSNNFKINIIEQNEESDFLKNIINSRNSNLESTPVKDQQEKQEEIKEDVEEEKKEIITEEKEENQEEEKVIENVQYTEKVI